MKIGSDKTVRKGIKWVKITHVAGGKWAVAQGWKGNIIADRVFTGRNKSWADLAAKSWINDQ